MELEERRKDPRTDSRKEDTRVGGVKRIDPFDASASGKHYVEIPDPDPPTVRQQQFGSPGLANDKKLIWSLSGALAIAVLLLIMIVISLFVG